MRSVRFACCQYRTGTWSKISERYGTMFESTLIWALIVVVLAVIVVRKAVIIVRQGYEYTIDDKTNPSRPVP